MAIYKNFNWLKLAAPKPTKVIAYTGFPDTLPSLLSSFVIQYGEDLRSPDLEKKGAGEVILSVPNSGDLTGSVLILF